MKKLSLNVDALAVESFELVAERARSAGTIRARESQDTGDTCPEPHVETDGDRSCYATHCAETNMYDCSEMGFCSVHCVTVGEC
jgi:hypothetical protein